MYLFIVPIIGILAILAGFFLLLFTVSPQLRHHEDFSVYGYRLVAVILFIGGILCVLSTDRSLIIASYAYTVVGIALLITSASLGYALRPQRAQRKAKPKRVKTV